MRLSQPYKDKFSLDATQSASLAIDLKSEACYEGGRLWKVIERFVSLGFCQRNYLFCCKCSCALYASRTSLCNVNDLRYQLIKVKKGVVDSGQDTLMSHAMRAKYQQCACTVKVRKNANIRNRYNQVPRPI